MRQLFSRGRWPLAQCAGGNARATSWLPATVCMTCSPKRLSRCAHCGKDRPAPTRWPERGQCASRATGPPCADGGACEGCGAERRLVSAPGPGARLCAGCGGVAPLATCRSCGAEERPYLDGCCVRCALAARAAELIGGTGGPLGAIYKAIAAGASALQRPQLAAPFGGGPPVPQSRLRPARPHPRGSRCPPLSPGRRLPALPTRCQRRAAGAMALRAPRGLGCRPREKRH